MRSRSAITAVAIFMMFGAAVAVAPSSGASSATVKIGRFTFPSGLASGSPIKIGVIGDVADVPQSKAMADATAQYVNQKLDGLAGHVIDIDYCDENLDPATAAACTQQWINNHDLVLGTGLPLVWDNAKTLSAGDVAYSSQGTGTTASTSIPLSYPLAGGSALTASAAGYIVAKHIKSVAIVTVNVPSGVAGAQLDQSLLKQNGVRVTSFTEHANGAPDLSGTVQQALVGKPAAIILNDGPQDDTREIPLLRSDGYQGKIFISFGNENGPLMQSLGSHSAGVYVETAAALPFDSTNPEVSLYNTIFKQSGLPASGDTGYAVSAFSLLMTEVAIGDKIGKGITTKSYVAYLKKINNFPFFMGYQLSSAAAPKAAAYGHLLDTYGAISTWDGTGFIFEGYYSGWSGAGKPGVGAQP